MVANRSIDNEEAALIRKLWDLGLSGSEIGARTGRSKNSVIGFAHRNNLTARPSPIKRGGRAQIAALRTPAARASLPPLEALFPALFQTVRHPVAHVVPPQAPAPIPRPGSGSCAWPMWISGERPQFVDGLPWLCGEMRGRGSYCAAHGALAYAGRRFVAEEVA